MSVAAALMLQYLLLACPEARGNLTPNEKQELRKIWYQKLAASKSVFDNYYSKFLDSPPEPLGSDFRRDKYVEFHSWYCSQLSGVELGLICPSRTTILKVVSTLKQL